MQGLRGCALHSEQLLRPKIQSSDGGDDDGGGGDDDGGGGDDGGGDDGGDDDGGHLYHFQFYLERRKPISDALVSSQIESSVPQLGSSNSAWF